MIQPNKKYLITTSNWFTGPDGESYRAVYGRATLFEAKQEFGFVPQRSANWYLKVGNRSKHILIAGCQVQYVIRTDERPDLIPGSYADQNTKRSIPNNNILFLD
jgi:hypothetical protein